MVTFFFHELELQIMELDRSLLLNRNYMKVLLRWAGLCGLLLIFKWFSLAPSKLKAVLDIQRIFMSCLLSRAYMKVNPEQRFGQDSSAIAYGNSSIY